MTTPIQLTDEQFAMVQRLEAETARFNEDVALREDPNAIQRARALITKGGKAGLPEVALVGLRTWVHLYDHRDH